MEHSCSKSPILCKSWGDYANMLVPLLCNIPLLCDSNQRYGLILTHSSILVWRIPWIEVPGSLKAIGSQSWTQLKWLSTHAWVNFMNPSLHFVIQTVFHIKTRRGKKSSGHCQFWAVTSSILSLSHDGRWKETRGDNRAGREGGPREWKSQIWKLSEHRKSFVHN